MVTKDDLYAEVLRQNEEIRELKEHLAIVYLELSNSEKKVFKPVDSQEGTD